MIVKIHNLSRKKNRLVGYLKVNEHDFDKVLNTKSVGDKDKFVTQPNEQFYRKVRKELNRKWQPEFDYRILSDNETKEIIESYERKIDFYQIQFNRLNTLKNL